LPIGQTAIALPKGGSAKEVNHLVDLGLHRVHSRRRLSRLPSTNTVPARGRFDAPFSRPSPIRRFPRSLGRGRGGRPLSVSEQLRGVFPDQDRVKKTVEGTIKVGNDLLAAKEFCAPRPDAPGSMWPGRATPAHGTANDRRRARPGERRHGVLRRVGDGTPGPRYPSWARRRRSQGPWPMRAGCRNEDLTGDRNSWSRLGRAPMPQVKWRARSSQRRVTSGGPRSAPGSTA
jgi:hypothetical protein